MRKQETTTRLNWHPLEGSMQVYQTLTTVTVFLSACPYYKFLCTHIIRKAGNNMVGFLARVYSYIHSFIHSGGTCGYTVHSYHTPVSAACTHQCMRQTSHMETPRHWCWETCVSTQTETFPLAGPTPQTSAHSKT